MEPIDALLGEVDKMTQSYSKKAAKNRKYALITHIVTAGLAVLTTVTIGLNSNDPSAVLNTVALILSGLVTLNQAISSFFNYKEFWIEFNDKANELRKINFDIKMEQVKGNIAPEKVLEFQKQYQSIIDSMNSFWRFNRSKNDSGK